MASDELFNIIYENPRDLERPKEILMFLDEQNGIQRRHPNPILPVHEIAEERPVIAVQNDPPPAVDQQAAIVRPSHIPQEPLISFGVPPVPVVKNSFQCKTPDCTGLWEYDDDVTTAKCCICQIDNCHQCRAIHTDLSCREYQDKIFTENDPTSIQKRNFYEQLIREGKAMKCLECDIIISRNEGFDWIQCTMCKFEICWATNGPRWGPGGKGDTSAGCRCGGTKGPKCHPKCNGCH